MQFGGPLHVVLTSSTIFNEKSGEGERIHKSISCDLQSRAICYGFYFVATYFSLKLTWNFHFSGLWAGRSATPVVEVLCFAKKK